MYYTVIRFPFSSLNEQRYVLALVLNSTADMTDLTDVLDRMERVFFKRGIDSTSGSSTVYNYEGTLTGQVKAVDDEREDVFSPLVRSKLSFNMAVENFPTWLMDFCATRRAKMVLYYDEGGGVLYEQWRGYLIEQTLNLTVVNDKLSVPLVAVDEVAMAKYLNFRESLDYVTNDHWCSLYGLMQHYHTLHHTRGLELGASAFEVVYQILGLTGTNSMMWNCNLRMVDDDGDSVADVPSTLCVNLDRWIADEKCTWEEVFTELFEYLGVNFAVGGWDGVVDCDAYLLTNPVDNHTLYYVVYDFEGSPSVETAPVYADLTNPTKYNANLQVTSEPYKYKKVIVTSEPERWESHEYLTDEHYPRIDETKEIRYEWGATDDATNGPYESYGWHKMQYTKPDDDEVDFLTIAPCADGEGFLMARNGELPYDDIDSCDGLTEPDASCADSLDFITFKEGACCIRMGGGEKGGIDEDRKLNPYFLIMNHMWGTMVNQTNHTMSKDEHIADTAWLKFRPLGLAAGVHPSEKHYLTLKMNVMFIRENFPVGSTHDGNPHQWNWFKSPGVGQSMRVVNWSSPAMIMPCDTTIFDFSDDSGPYGAAYYGGLSAWNTLKFKAYIHVGNYYYNGSNWAYIASGQTKPKCDVIMMNQTTEVTEIDKYGFYTLHTGNYYYTISCPSWGNMSTDEINEHEMYIDMGGVSIHGQPVHGVLEIEVLGQIAFVSSNGLGYGQSIPFVLMSKIDINYSDAAEMKDADIANKETVVMDASSTTKDDMEKELKMATPEVSGFFNNVLVYDGGKAWHNIHDVLYQHLSSHWTLEQMKAKALANQYSAGQVFVEFETPVNYEDNVHNVGFRVSGLVEVDGTFLPVKREFDYTRDTMRVKLMRLNALPSS